MKLFLCNKKLLPLLFFLLPFSSSAYGVLTHEAIVDASWNNSIVPLLKKKFPGTSDSALKEAHAYAYGGAVAPDMGFYPFGSNLFTNLVHYVRSGEMVTALLRDASNLNEYAFALGFLSHYYADKYGHPLATNRSVPLTYPRLQKKYGRFITYAENRIDHMRMEFGFDVLEVAKGNYASQAYHNFIGFKVDTAVLSKAFLETYGLNINDIFKSHLQLSVETFRWIVANIFPGITKAAWVSKKHSILVQVQTPAERHFTYRMRQKQYDKQFGKGYSRPGFYAAMLSFLIRALPKVGPTRALRFKSPTLLSEKYLEQSIDTVLIHYSVGLNQLKHRDLQLKDIDWDTGKPTADCEYSLANQTYQNWLLNLSRDRFKAVDYKLQQNIVHFFHLSTVKYDHNNKKCQKFDEAFKALSGIPFRGDKTGSSL